MFRPTFLVALLSLTVPNVLHASPLQSPSPSQCAAVSKVVSALKVYSAATSFCSSYLHISTITNTATVTSAITSSVQTTGTITVTGAATTTTVTNTVSTCTDAPVNKRANVALPPKSSTAKPTTSSAKPTTSSVKPLPSCVQSFPTTQISSACSCLGIPTPTSTTTLTVKPTATIIQTLTAVATVTPTSTATVTTTATTACPTCDNTGLEWAFYPNQAGGRNDDSYSNFDTNVYKTTTPSFQDVTNYFGFDYPNNGVQQIYTHTIGDGTPTPFDYFVINHRGYIVAPYTGTYSFASYDGGQDDALIVWLGPVARSGWDRTNGYSPPFTFDLVGGQYTPIRAMYADAQGGGFMQLDIKGPNGDIVERGLGYQRTGGTYTAPGLFRRYSCDGVVAPAYPAFGNET